MGFILGHFANRGDRLDTCRRLFLIKQTCQNTEAAEVVHSFLQNGMSYGEGNLLPTSDEPLHIPEVETWENHLRK